MTAATTGRVETTPSAVDHPSIPELMRRGFFMALGAAGIVPLLFIVGIFLSGVLIGASG